MWDDFLGDALTSISFWSGVKPFCYGREFVSEIYTDGKFTPSAIAVV
jgi:hypothetical protein